MKRLLAAPKLTQRKEETQEALAYLFRAVWHECCDELFGLLLCQMAYDTSGVIISVNYCPSGL